MNQEQQMHPYDIRGDVIRQTLDQITQENKGTLTARQALADMERELYELRLKVRRDD
jgi:hypothetical protein